MIFSAYPRYAASVLAANSFGRSALAGIFPLFGTESAPPFARPNPGSELTVPSSVYNRLGTQWWSSRLLAFLTLAMSPFREDHRLFPNNTSSTDLLIGTGTYSIDMAREFAGIAGLLRSISVPFITTYT
jgi:hypothetical protein